MGLEIMKPPPLLVLVNSFQGYGLVFCHIHWVGFSVSARPWAGDSRLGKLQATRVLLSLSEIHACTKWYRLITIVSTYNFTHSFFLKKKTTGVEFYATFESTNGGSVASPTASFPPPLLIPLEGLALSSGRGVKISHIPLPTG